MSFAPRPCPHCNSAQFHIVPRVELEPWKAVTVLGMAASSKLPASRRWQFTLVICAQCGRTETFTANGPEMASSFEGSQLMTTPRQA